MKYIFKCFSRGKMRKFILICLCSFTFACTSVEHIPNLNRTLDRDYSQVKQARLMIDRQYIIYHAQHETIRLQIKEANIAEFEQLSSQFKKITQLKNEFQERDKKLYTTTILQRQIWGNKAKVTSNDPEWDELDEFRDYSKSEFKSLIDIRNTFQKEELAFNKTLKGISINCQ